MCGSSARTGPGSGTSPPRSGVMCLLDHYQFRSPPCRRPCVRYFLAIQLFAMVRGVGVKGTLPPLPPIPARIFARPLAECDRSLRARAEQHCGDFRPKPVERPCQASHSPWSASSMNMSLSVCLSMGCSRKGGPCVQHARGQTSGCNNPVGTPFWHPAPMKPGPGETPITTLSPNLSLASPQASLLLRSVG